MNLSSDYIRIIDEFRISKQLSVSALCENIISERTYYRLLKSKEIKIDTFTKLAHKLGIELFDLVHYSVFSKKDDSRFKFCYRVHTRYFWDIKPHYEIIKNHHDDCFELGLLLKTYVKKYEMLIGKITKDEYHQVLNEHMELLKDSKLPNVYVTFFFVCYIDAFPENEIISVEKVGQILLEDDIRMCVIMSIISIDLYMNRFVNTDMISDDLFQKLIQKMELYNGYFPNKYFYMNYCLYCAKNAQGSQQIAEMQKYLYRHLIILTIITDGDDYHEKMRLVENLFQINPQQFLIEQTHQILV